MTALLRQDLSEGIAAARQALEQPRSQVDGIFVAAGAKLITCVERLRKVTALFASLPATLEGEGMTRAVDMISTLSQRTLAIANGMKSGGGDLSDLTKALSRASSPIDQLLRIMKTMGILSVNARVAAASLGASAVDVDIFWQDLGGLAQSANGVVARISEGYQNLAGRVAAASQARARFVMTQHGPLRQISSSLNERLAAVDELRRGALKTTAEISETTRSLADRVSSAVVAMQAGDAARQRFDHIEQAFAKLEEEEQGENVVSLVAHLQLRQLEAARQELADETDSANAAVSGIVKDLQAAQQTARKSGGGDRDSVLRALETAVRQAAEALYRCEADRQAFEAMTAHVVTAVNDILALASELEELEYQTKLVSLNATIRCAHMGERGRALTVIAQQLRELTEDTATSTRAAVNDLRTAADVSARLSSQDGDGLARGTDQLASDAKAALGVLAGVNTDLTAAGQELDRELLQVRDGLHQVLSLLATNLDVFEHLDVAADALASAASAVEPGDGSLDSALFASLRKFYSVEAERQIHDAVIGGEAIEETQPDAEGDPLDAMLF